MEQVEVRSVSLNPYREPPEGHLTAHCWCRYTYVHVPRVEILNGLTRPCNHPACQREDRDARQLEAAS